MKYLTLNEIPFEEPIVPNDGNPPVLVLDYRKTLLDILRFSPQGIDFAEMEQVLDIRKLIKTAPKLGEVELEDAQYAYLLQRVKAARMNFFDDAFVQFYRDVCSPRPVRNNP